MIPRELHDTLAGQEHAAVFPAVEEPEAQKTLKELSQRQREDANPAWPTPYPGQLPERGRREAVQ